ncbi:MAG: TRAP transporter small permease subunit [Pseudoflavonifractor sp.]
MLVKIQKAIDSITTAIGGILIAIMFVVIMANVILRLIPMVGGFSWYMEFSQYANVWAMFIGAIGIVVRGTNLRVEIIDSLVERFSWGRKLTCVIVDVGVIAFYSILAYSGIILATKAKQAVSTMQSFTMGQVYAIIPIVSIICVAVAILHLAVELTAKPEEKGEDTP